MYKLLITNIQPNQAELVVNRKYGPMSIFGTTKMIPSDCYQYLDDGDTIDIVSEIGAAQLYCRSVAYGTGTSKFDWQLLPIDDTTHDETYHFHEPSMVDMESRVSIDILHGELAERLMDGEEPTIEVEVQFEHDKHLAIIVRQSAVKQFKGDIEALASEMIANYLEVKTRLTAL